MYGKDLHFSYRIYSFSINAFLSGNTPLFRLISFRMRLTIIFRFERVSCGRIRQQKSDPIVSLISASNSCHVPSNKFLSILCPTGHGLRYSYVPWISCLPQSIQYLLLSRLFIACFSSLHPLLMGIFLFTTPPHIGQKRTGALTRP